MGCELASPNPVSTPTTLPPPVAAGFTIDFIDVGQGDATLITAITGETLLVNGGRSKARIRDRLESMGIKDLDAITLTPPDADHVAGLVEVLEMFLLSVSISTEATTQALTPLLEMTVEEVKAVVKATPVSLASPTVDSH